MKSYRNESIYQATETTNQLELSFDQLVKKIETLEKATVVQQLERSENNNKASLYIC